MVGGEERDEREKGRGRWKRGGGARPRGKDRQNGERGCETVKRERGGGGGGGGGGARDGEG